MRKNTSLFYWALLGVAVRGAHAPASDVAQEPPKPAAPWRRKRPALRAPAGPTTITPRAQVAKAPPVEEQTLCDRDRGVQRARLERQRRHQELSAQGRAVRAQGPADERRHDQQAAYLPADVPCARRSTSAKTPRTTSRRTAARACVCRPKLTAWRSRASSKRAKGLTSLGHHHHPESRQRGPQASARGDDLSLRAA